MNAPPVSVIVPVHNGAPYLERCLDSLAAQTLPGLEAIIVDDASTDDTPAILKRWSAVSPGMFRYVRLQTRQGPGGARNAGLGIAQGRYVCFADSDDEVLPDMFAKLQALAEETCADMAVCGFTLINAEGDVRNFLPPASLTLREVSLSRRWLSSPWNKIFRRSFLEVHGIRFPLTYFSEDMVFVMRTIFSCPRLSVLPESLYRYYMNENSVSNNIRARTGSLTSLAALREDVERLPDADGSGGLSLGERRRAWRRQFFMHALYYPCCSLLLGQGAVLDRLRDFSAYCLALLRFLTTGRL
ncbi:MAG: glycosyltransferase [Desulfovibrio sp.]|jgi:glycosyltransferase involved in cell wall biosynthesis|nr:glycosyltransferase [Desulfovibrio sp.]